MGAVRQGERTGGGTLGTFGGVFTPSVLTILGIILFLRLGYVMGAAGTWRGLAIIVLANAISVLTSVSLSAIATNLRVKGGGDYYLISRTLGVEFGGALGVVLFLAQSVSIAFYAIGFGEAVAALGVPLAPQVVAAAAVLALFGLAWIGADWATRFQFGIMAVLFVALAAFAIGGARLFDAERLLANDGDPTIPFWAVFAIFFPAVTGFTQGVSMSGDLRDPGRSLPLGTFLAVGLSFAVYLAAGVLMAGALPPARLVADTGAMRHVAISAGLVDAGVIAATLSSALASFLGAPRILQSLAADRVFPGLAPFAVGHGPSGNPRRGTLLAGALALGTIALGNLNAVAAVVSMFFLISYGLLNYATFFEARANSPWFRPRFRWFDARLSLAGALACLGAMLALSPLAGAIALAVLFALHRTLEHTAAHASWADSERSHRFRRVRDDLHAIARDPAHPRDWRPIVLAFSEQPERRERLLRFASWIEGGAGFTTLVRFVQAEGPGARRAREEAERELSGEIRRHGLEAYARAVAGRDPTSAVAALLQAHGLGPVRPNTVLLNWFDQSPNHDEPPGLAEYGRYLRLALRYGCSVVVLGATARAFAALLEAPERERGIDVWFRDDASGRLSLLLAYLMTRAPAWSDARIRVLAPRPRAGTDEEALAELERVLDEARIPAEAELVDDLRLESVRTRSQAASITFLPFRLRDAGPTSVTDEPLDPLVRELGVVALVLAASDIALDAEPDAGPRAAEAAEREAAARARGTAERLARELEEAGRALDAARAAREAAGAGEDSAALDARVREAEEELEALRRRHARALAKAGRSTPDA